ncbi:TrkH family potassium uptake protein, partial [Treponema sp. R6D11]
VGFRLGVGYLGYILMFWGVCLALPLTTLFFFKDSYPHAWIFIVLSISTFLIGFLISLVIKNYVKGPLENHEDAIILTVIWIVSTIVCGLPYLLFGKYNFSQSIFESISGLSTSGLTVFPNIDATPKIILLWRSFTMLFGGIGLVLSLAVLLSGGNASKIYAAEGHHSRPLPNFVKSARLIFTVYFFYIILGTTLYTIAGMPIFDAFNHSICVLATGGFSTRSDNIGAFRSAAIDYISIFLMILGAANFYAHVLLLSGKFKKFFTHTENKAMFLYGIGSALVLSLILASFFTLPFAEGFRVSLFYIFSAMSTTGFSTATHIPITMWPFSALLILQIFFLIGGSSESTAGGIKLYRVTIAFKSVWWHIKKRWTSKREMSTFSINKFGKIFFLSEEERLNIYSFIFLYICVCLIGAVAVCLLGGFRFVDSWFEFTSALGNIGLSSGITTYACPNSVLWVNSIGMLLGRLEIVIVILAGMKVFSLARNHILNKRA